jgi:hypothetical protein
MKALAKASERNLVCSSVVLATRTHGGGLVGRACRSARMSECKCTSTGAARTASGASTAARIVVKRILSYVVESWGLIDVRIIHADGSAFIPPSISTAASLHYTMISLSISSTSINSAISHIRAHGAAPPAVSRSNLSRSIAHTGAIFVFLGWYRGLRQLFDASN